MQIKMLILRWSVGLIFFMLIVSPSVLTALVWTTLNFYITFASVLISLVLSIVFPKIKWVSATVSSLIVAIPPYPHWLKFNSAGKVVLNDRFNFSGVYGFTVLFAFSMCCFVVMFWSMRWIAKPVDELVGH